MLLHELDEADVRRVLRHPWAMIGSDGLPAGEGGSPHPRACGTFPRVLGRYVRELSLLTLEQAVHKMTGLPADTFRLARRGVVAPGNFADLVVFDFRRIRDRASYAQPLRPPTGVAWVYQAGVLVVDGQRYVGNRQGRLLRPRTPGRSVVQEEA